MGGSARPALAHCHPLWTSGEKRGRDKYDEHAYTGRSSDRAIS